MDRFSVPKLVAWSSAGGPGPRYGFDMPEIGCDMSLMPVCMHDGCTGSSCHVALFSLLDSVILVARGGWWH